MNIAVYSYRYKSADKLHQRKLKCRHSDSRTYIIPIYGFPLNFVTVCRKQKVWLLLIEINVYDLQMVKMLKAMS